MDEAAILATCQEIHAYAEAHYEDSGWSVITECYTPKDMVKEMSYWEESPSSPEDVWESWKVSVSIWGERMADAINSAF